MLLLFQEPLQLVWVLVVGLVAGVLGGLLGVGGSIVMIPGLTFVLGYDQHLYQAAAMVANVAVSVPATLQHRKAGAIVPAALRWMIPIALLMILLGVWASNRQLVAGEDGGKWLGRILALFCVYVIYVNLRKLRSCPFPDSGVQAILTPFRCSFVGASMGFAAGLLGIGGGALAVPLQQFVLRLPLRNCIANSSAIICVSAGLGAAYKCGSLATHSHHWSEGFVMGLVLVPTAWAGGRFGGSLAHILPLRQLRVAFVLFMLAAAWKMAAIPFF